MKLNYYAETDSLYIEFSDDSSVKSVEISEGVVLDYDAKGKLVGIDIDSFHPEMAIFRNLGVNLRDSLCGVLQYASA